MSEKRQQFDAGEVLFRQPESRQPGRLDLAVDLRQAVGEEGAVEAGQQCDDGLKEAVQGIDAAATR